MGGRRGRSRHKSCRLFRSPSDLKLQEQCEWLEIWLKEDLPEEKMLHAYPLTLLDLPTIDDVWGRKVSSESHGEELERRLELG